MTDQKAITIRHSDHEISKFVRALFFRPLLLSIVFFTGIYFIVIGLTVYTNSDLSPSQQIVFNVIWAGIYYVYLLALSPRAVIFMLDHRIPLFLGIWALLIVPCTVEAIVGAFWLNLFEATPIVIAAHIIKNLFCMVPGLTILLSLLKHKYEPAFFYIPPIQYVWFRWEDRLGLAEVPSPVAPNRLEALSQYCTIYRPDMEPEIERISLTEAIEKYCLNIDGMRVHRSHWVAFDQVCGFKYVNGNPRIKLESGDTIPVSRKAYKELKARCEAQMIAANAQIPIENLPARLTVR